ncbi:type II toxin-antitoxin system death-on-curing family toxin [Sulfurivermis fontis]|uniref:type II toxin-antitoxin system death-on-curing family toxin n=1 Tax=Sulfurivermis fontis TaxID=1972068 RepID=UPI0018D5431C|nr:type II toxin-antitoxin system death-on-curing family toxin [Sulfurivermis fontis]
MTAFVWLDEAVVQAVHESQLAEHGGPAGIRDAGLLASALDRPKNLAAYGEPDAADCAAAYAFGIARNHPFIDGNKRTAFVCMELFMALNGMQLTAGDAACVLTTLALAAGDMDEAALALWLREHSAPR